MAWCRQATSQMNQICVTIWRHWATLFFNMISNKSCKKLYGEYLIQLMGTHHSSSPWALSYHKQYFLYSINSNELWNESQLQRGNRWIFRPKVINYPGYTDNVESFFEMSWGFIEVRWRLDGDNYSETVLHFTPPSCLKMAWLKILLHHQRANELMFWCG